MVDNTRNLSLPTDIISFAILFYFHSKLPVTKVKAEFLE